jgi:CRP-like cAMP-binding protein
MKLARRALDPKIERLRTIDLFSGCRAGELTRIAQLLDEVEIPAGEVIMREGRPGWEAMVVQEGTASVSVGGRPVDPAGPGALLGEVALIGDHLRTATVVAQTPMRVFVMDSRGFGTLRARHPRVSERIDRETEAHGTRLAVAD